MAQRHAEFAEARSLAAHLAEARTVREEAWRELAEWIAPHRGMFAGEDLAPSGGRRNRHAFTLAATQALLRGASGMTGGMTPRNSAWFEPDFQEPALAEASGARVWLDEVDRRMKTALAEGGFYQAIQNFNTDLLWAGCALLYMERGTRTLLRLETVPVGSFCLALDAEGRPDAVCRTLIRTPAALAATFGTRSLTEGTRRKLATRPHDPIRVVHLVRRRDVCNPGKADRHAMPWESLFWEESGSSDFLHRGGYHEMPYFTFGIVYC